MNLATWIAEEVIAGTNARVRLEASVHLDSIASGITGAQYHAVVLAHFAHVVRILSSIPTRTAVEEEFEAVAAIMVVSDLHQAPRCRASVMFAPKFLEWHSSSGRVRRTGEQVLQFQQRCVHVKCRHFKGELRRELIFQFCELVLQFYFWYLLQPAQLFAQQDDAADDDDACVVELWPLDGSSPERLRAAAAAKLDAWGAGRHAWRDASAVALAVGERRCSDQRGRVDYERVSRHMDPLDSGESKMPTVSWWLT